MSATTSGSDPRAVPCQALEIGSSSGSLEPDEVSSQQALDELSFNEAERATLVDHAKQAFTLNSAVFADLAGISPVLVKQL